MGIRWAFAAAKKIAGGARRYRFTAQLWLYFVGRPMARRDSRRWPIRTAPVDDRSHRHNVKMVARKRITPEALRRAFDDLPTEISGNSRATSLALGSAILRGFFSDEWVERFLISDDQKKSFFTVDESSDVALRLSFLRTIDLAELLYNLQHVSGFSWCIEKMRLGDLEGTLAELDFGRMLYLNRVPFRFVRERGRRRFDYDVELVYPNGLAVCADAKCKIEGTNPSPNKVMSTLGKARKQLPKDRPGIVFVKVPHAWVRNDEAAAMMVEQAQAFLKGTQHIISVKYYAARVTCLDDVLTHTHSFKEVSNPATDFGNGKDWSIFRKVDGVSGWNGMPSHWLRIIHYPDGISR